MKLNFLREAASAVSTAAAKALFKMKKNSPELLIAAGIGLVITGTVIACTQTGKAKELLAKQKEDLAETDQALEEYPEEYTERDYTLDRIGIRGKYFGKLTLCYLPAVLAEGAGIACILGAYGIMKKRAAVLMAAYEAVSTAYMKYRDRVREEFGEETEEAIYHGKPLRKAVPVKTNGTDEEHGGVDIIEQIECSDRYQDHMPSPFARFFDESSRMYKKNAEMNLTFLRQQQRLFNLRLYTRGFVMLNEVYEALDIPETAAGAIHGWIKNKADEPTVTIDFGIYNGYQEGCRDFVNGYERSILLDFNVDPKPIWNRI